MATSASPEIGSPVRLFARAIEGGTNDELLELTYRLIEELAERVENAADIAIDSDDRDVENEALTFAQATKRFTPAFVSGGRLEAAQSKIRDAEHDIEAAINNRRSSLDGRSRVEPFSRRRHARVRSAWDVKRRRELRHAEQLAQDADITAERVMNAMIATGGEVRAKEIAIALLPKVADTSMAGRQTVINRVAQVMRTLAKEGRLVQIRPDDYDGRRKLCRYAVPNEVDDDA